MHVLHVTGYIPPHDSCYNDGPDFPTSPLLQQAEQAYREAYLLAVREAVRWSVFSKRILRAAWDERERVREQAEIWVPSALLLGDPLMESEQIVYRKGHEIAASRARGRVQAFEMIEQTQSKLFEAGYRGVTIRERVIKPWREYRIEPWAVTPIDPMKLDMPRWPMEWLQRYAIDSNDAELAQAANVSVGAR